MFEIEPPLGHRLWSNYIPLHMSLNRIRDTNFHIIGAHPPDVVTRTVPILDMGGRHCELDSNQGPK